MISILNRPHELRAHIRGALTSRVSRDEIREVFMWVAIYASIPAGVRQLPHRARSVRPSWLREREEGRQTADHEEMAENLAALGGRLNV